ncbi:MAG: UTP--glucose-1-phosphate uridylyltransferase [Bacteroidales bacterium]
MAKGAIIFSGTWHTSGLAPGHWHEFPNLLRNGVLSKTSSGNPGVKHILLHNIDTLGATVSEKALAFTLRSGKRDYSAVPRRIDDQGGGLARINGKLRLLEGLAQPHEEDELKLRYYNTLTC